jgi:PAS domain S-box-containing protein
MTQILVSLAFGLFLAAIWVLIRSSTGPRVAAVDGTGDRVLLDQSPVGTLLLDPALRVTWANDAFCDLFGLIRSDLIGRGFSDVVQQELKGLVAEPDGVEAGLMAAYTSASKASPFEFAVRARDERDERLVEHSCQVIEHKPLEGGRVAYFVDVTPRRTGAVTDSTQGVQLHELDRILVKLARRSGGGDEDEGSVMREVAELAASTWKPDRWEIWSLGEDRTLWSLDHLDYATPRPESDSAPQISIRQTGPYLRALDQVRVMVTSDLKADPDAHTLVGNGSIEPEAASRLDLPIRVRGKVVAVLVVAHHTPRPWAPSERRFAASVGDRLSLLVEACRVEDGSSTEVPTQLPPAASSTVDGFIHLDEKLRFTFLNPAVLRWLAERGVDGGSLVGRTLEDSMKDIKETSIIAEVRKAVRGGGPARLGRQLERDGPWLDVFITPSATGVSVTIQNRARQKERQAERSLRDSETRFRSVVESLHEALIITDLNDRIVYVNSRVSDLTGRRPEDLDGQQAQELLFDTENWKAADSRMAARRDKKRTRYDAPLLDKEGGVARVEVISTPLRGSGGAVTGVVDAITALGNEVELESERAEEAGGAS